LASAGGSADAPACGQAVGANLARTNLDFGRARWLRGNAERMNGQAKDLNERNTFFICDTVNQGKIFGYLRLFPLILVYLRLMGKNVRGAGW
jgi:hypothetical protein